MNCLTYVISVSFYFSAVMYTLMLVRLLSVCSGGVGRSSWRGGAGIIKLWRGASGTPLYAIRGFLAAHVDVSGSSENAV